MHHFSNTKVEHVCKITFVFAETLTRHADTASRPKVIGSGGSTTWSGPSTIPSPNSTIA